MTELGMESTDASSLLSAQILRRWFLDDLGVTESEFDEASGDLVRWGVIDSLALVELLEWLSVQIGKDLYAIELSVENFRTIDTILALVAQSG